MKTLLQLTSSLFSGDGQSSRLAENFVARWKGANPDGLVIVRDLARSPVPHLDAARFGAFLAKPESRTAEQSAVIRYSDALIDELRRADVIVLGLPMYNFGVPSTLKAYFDHIARAGVTFRYTEKGAIGLLSGKQAYVLATRGGKYAGTPFDLETGFVRQFLAFLGIADVEFIYAEGLALGEASVQSSLSGARAAIDRIGDTEALALAA
jgi:FMN-dependent NADH-azoreductase